MLVGLNSSAINSRSYWLWCLFPAVAVSLGWALRGSIGGGSLGAMIPGAMIGLALCMLFGRSADAGRIAAFGAIGVGFGGQETYGQTVGLSLVPDTFWWAILGFAIKGAVWGLLGGAFLGIALERRQFTRGQLIIGFTLMVAGTWIGWKLVNEPKLIYFSNRLDRPREELWAGLWLGGIALLVWLRARIPTTYAIYGAIGGGIGFAFGASLQPWGKAHWPQMPVGWWKAMEFTFGALLGVAYGMCARRSMITPPAPPEPTAPRRIVAPLLAAATSILLIFGGEQLPIRFGYTVTGAILASLILLSESLAWQTAITATYAAFSIDFLTKQTFAPSPLMWMLAVVTTVVVALLVERYPAPRPMFLLLTWTAVLNSVRYVLPPHKIQPETSMLVIFVFFAILVSLYPKKLVAGLATAACLFAAPPVSFQRDVQPVLAQRCQMCHGARNPGGGLSLATTSAMLKGGASGPALRPSDPDSSLLIKLVTGPKPAMPKAGAPLTPEQIATLRQWIAEGAKDDSPAKPQQWWSLAPLRRTPGSTIDSFILAKLQAANLQPSPEADRRTLIRRLTFDLHGLPPTPADIDAFEKDKSPDAYEKLVHRLLASPRYGERWARHWMDVIHYGESHGYDKDKPRLNAWPYRDWLIRAFNEDKPYSRFIEEQIAGDVLFPGDPNAFVATGFLAAGPWDFVGHQELKEGTAEKDNTRVLDRDDMVATAMSAFTSTTVHCARCHDHKFDPIPQQEYYNLQSVFAGVDRADRPFDDDPAIHQRRQQLMREKLAVQIRLQPLLDRVEFATSPEIVKLSDSIQDASLLLVHMGQPKTPAEAANKKELELRRDTDRKRRQELVDAIVGPETYAEIERIKAEFKPIDDQLTALPKPRLVYSGTNYFNRAMAFRPALFPRPVSVLDRGNVRAARNPAVPGALSAVPGLTPRFDLADPQDEGARRAALARWISDKNNVLTWRSIVNRVWQYHFGAGIVDTANDFGRMGRQPSHPELLDWLALWFRDDASGSLKKLHRLIVISAAYRQSSASRPEAAKVDGENRLLWRMNRTRIDAEALRDAMLAASGKLDLTMGGPSVQMFWFKDDHSPVYDYARFNPDSPGAYRRSIYRFIVRSVPDPFMDRLDCPDPSVLTPKRSTTITAIQALAVWNNAFVLRMSEHFAERLQQSSPDLAAQINNAFNLALGRPATSEELAAYSDYARKHGLANMARVLFNTNEFSFVD